MNHEGVQSIMLVISWLKLDIFCKRSFLIGGAEVGEIIPFPVWINLFPVFKTGFENRK